MLQPDPQEAILSNTAQPQGHADQNGYGPCLSVIV